MNRALIALLAIIILGGGALWYTQSHPMNRNNMASSTTADQNGQQPAGSQPSASLVASENLMGKWQDTTDPKNVIEFGASNDVTWVYDGEKVGSGLYVVFTAANAPKIVSFPIDPNAVYLQTTETGAQSDTQNFRISMSADANSLTLTYMDRGGATMYTRVQ
jgi:hypothetical protein